MKQFGYLSGTGMGALSFCTRLSKLSALVIVLTMTPCISAYANDCDEKAADMESNFVNAWRGSYRDHGVLKEGWDQSRYKRAFPNCTMSYEEYFGLGGRKSPPKRGAPSKISPLTTVTPPIDKSKENLRRLSKAQSEASKDSSLNPWGPTAKETGKASSSTNSAPYADGNCVSFLPATPGGVSWDDVKIANRCKFPVQVIVCYYDKGDEPKCGKSLTTGRWGTTQTIPPGKEIYSVSSASKPRWLARYYVCNMQNAKKGLLCLLPSNKTATVAKGN
jgi:hypothetical protein